MDENWNREMNSGNDNSAGQTSQNSDTSYTQYNNTAYNNTYNAQPTQGYYGSYKPPVNNYYEPPKKKKKKGGKIVIAIVVFVLIFSALVLGNSIMKYSDKQNQPSGDNTKLDLLQPPSSDEEKIPADSPLSAKDVYKKVHNSSVGVIVYSGNATQVYSEGTGIVMGYNSDKTGTYIITCAHVIDAKNPKIVIQTADDKQYDGYVVGLDAKTDIGVVRVEGTELKPADFAESTALEVGDEVYAIGNPGGTQFFGSFTDGIVSAIGRPVDSPVGYEVACIQHTAPINPGNSGGALVNEYGQVIGINSSKIASTEYEGMGFAVPSATVKEIVDELIKNGKVMNRPALGIEFSPATSNQVYSIILRANDLPAGSIVIAEILNGSDLANTQAKEGDMIVAVNGENLDSYETLMEVIENGKVGDTLTLTIARIDGNYKVTTFDVTVKLVDESTTSKKQTSNESTFPFPFE